VLVGAYESSEEAVLTMLRDMLSRRLDYARKGERFFDAAQNAHVVADAERYYGAMYYGSATSWNLRDTHIFDTLQSLLALYGPSSRGDRLGAQLPRRRRCRDGDERAWRAQRRATLSFDVR
jgi:protein-L-isoaspartate(D-aspartate) O-methyltransferase